MGNNSTLLYTPVTPLDVTKPAANLKLEIHAVLANRFLRVFVFVVNIPKIHHIQLGHILFEFAIHLLCVGFSAAAKLTDEVFI